MSKIKFEMTGDEDLDKLLKKINKGDDINIEDDSKNTALIYASYYGHTEICKLLIETGADVNIQDDFGSTALIWASIDKNIGNCKLLIENGADINIENNSGYTPIDSMKDEGIYIEVNPYKILGLKYFQKVFKEYAEDYLDIFETTLYSQDLELDAIKANIDMFYSTVINNIENNNINENDEL